MPCVRPIVQADYKTQSEEAEQDQGVGEDLAADTARPGLRQTGPWPRRSDPSLTTGLLTRLVEFPVPDAQLPRVPLASYCKRCSRSRVG